MAEALAGQRALVVGGGSGIGLATARLLAADGAHVTLAGRTVAKLEDAAASIDGSVGVVGCDVLDAADVRNAVAVAEGDEGLHIAVTVPGGGPFRPVLGYGDDEFDEAVRANLRPQFLVLKHAGAAMVRTGGGSIIAVSSTVADFPMPFNAGYSVGKAGVDQLVRIAADELGGVGVRVNGVRPGLTATDSTARMVGNPELMARFLEQQPIKRTGQPDDIAAAIRYLAGPESSWVTGQILTVDGGHTLRRFPDLTDIARATLGDDVFDAVMRGEVPR
ncbi:MAG: short-chain dehydrogenase/reductase [Acidimicrobiales bacterium]|nr:short-chain dehydrogenase/reductase [Acidimicrobiales bacterium]